LTPKCRGESLAEDESERSAMPTATVTAQAEPAARRVPFAIEPEGDVEPARWARDHRELIESTLLSSGAILFRGFEVSSPEAFERFTEGVTDLRWTGNPTLVSPRRRVSGSVYTSTEGWYSRDGKQEAADIALHAEFCHSPFRRWPMKLFFYCDTPPETGGETPIADSRRVLARLDPALRDELVRRQVMYTRIMYDDPATTWRQVFQTDDREEVVRRCAEMGVAHDWLNENDLRLRWKLHVAAKHPITGEAVWFNQCQAISWSAVPPDAREYYTERFGAENRPLDCTYGDGAPIPASVIDEINRAFAAETIKTPWRRGDVLLLDNMLMSHGRSAFTGARRIMVAMAEPMDAAGVECV
jgi:alpha-ketoglutarate-dependent taurine dioxygenase